MAAEGDPPPGPAVGGAAILARLRAQRAAAAGGAAAAPPAPPAAAAQPATNGITAAATPAAAAAAAAAAASAPPAPAAAAAAAAAAPEEPAVAAPAPIAAPAAPVATAPAPAKPAGPPAATGGAAILARLRAQRAAKAPAPPPSKQVVVLYASQTGTAQEIAKNIQAEAEARGIKSKVASMNEFGFDSLNAAEAPVLVYVASSTGDGDAPDNSGKFYATLRRKSHAPDLLAGIAFTGFGLGDSNYTRYMYVPRAIKQRLEALGAAQFYEVGEADEVDGIEGALDKWIDGLWAALKKAAQPEGSGEGADSTAAAGGEAASAAAGGKPTAAAEGGSGVPPLPRCRVRLAWEGDAGAAAAVRAAEADVPGASDLAFRDPAGVYSAEQPFWAPLTDARYLTTELSGADRQVLHLEVDVGESGMRLAPGDSLGLLPQNDPALVEALLARLGLDGEAVFDVAPADDGQEEAAAGAGAPGAANGAAAGATDGGDGAQQAQRHREHLLPHLRAPCSVRAALSRGVDVTGPPRKSLLRLLAEHCDEPAERAALLRLCSREGREQYAADMLAARPSLLHLLSSFPSCRPPLDALLDALPPLAARMYSLSNSPLEHPGKAQVAFTVVRYRTEQYGEHHGVATTWLHRLADPLARSADPVAAAADAAVRLPVFLRRGGAFGPPASLAAPLIMIGPGTGVTPFRGFLQHRRAQIAAATGSTGGGTEEGPETGSKEKGGSQKAPAWLFFGCRREDQDYLYRQDLEAFVAEGTLDRLLVAFSRAQQHKVYVQHLMQQHASELHDLIARQGAYIYVCGDGAGMAKDVHACLTSILQQEGGISEVEATERLHELTRQGRYVRDIWS